MQLRRRLVTRLEAVELAGRHTLRGALDLHVDVLGSFWRGQYVLVQLFVAEHRLLLATVIIIVAELVQDRPLRQRLYCQAAPHVLILAVSRRCHLRHDELLICHVRRGRIQLLHVEFLSWVRRSLHLIIEVVPQILLLFILQKVAEVVDDVFDARFAVAPVGVVPVVLILLRVLVQLILQVEVHVSFFGLFEHLVQGLRAV